MLDILKDPVPMRTFVYSEIYQAQGETASVIPQGSTHFLMGSINFQLQAEAEPSRRADLDVQTEAASQTRFLIYCL